MGRIYLDHHVAPPPHPKVVERIAASLGDLFPASSGLHAESKTVREAIEWARQRILQLITNGATGGELIFTGSGAEALCLGLLGYCRANGRFGRHVIISEIEHPALLQSAKQLEREGFVVDRIGVDHEGRLNEHEVFELMREETILIGLQMANPELGGVHSLGLIGQEARQRGITFLVDGTLAEGCSLLDVQALKADLLVLSPRRFGGFSGVGVLYRSHRTVLEPLYWGGDQENGLRPGRENLVGILAAGHAAEILVSEQVSRIQRSSSARDRLLNLMKERITPIQLNGPELGSKRLCHHLSVMIPGVEAEGLVLFADLRGLAISTGGGCLSRGPESDYVMRAAGFSHEEALHTISLGVAPHTTREEIIAAVEILVSGVERIRSMTPG